jgi:hypothetical protein
MRTLYNIGSIETPRFIVLQDKRTFPRKPAENLSLLRRSGFAYVNKPVSDVNNQLSVLSIPLSKIFIKRDWFQNRKNDFSQESVTRILEAVKNGSFQWQVFDPVLLWKNPQDEKLYILSGHSRTEAFKQLSREGITYQGKTFNSIPAKIILASIDQAKKIALESNILSTKESDVERANYYRNLRKAGKPLKDILELAQKNEGKDASKIFSFSFLSENGKAYDALENLDKADQQSKSIIQTVANWLGFARNRFPMLSDYHENEIFDFLVIHGGYGNKKGQLYNRAEFIQRIESLINKNSFFGKLDPQKPLNIRSLIYKDSFEIEHEKRVNLALKELNESKLTRDAKLRELIKRKATTDQIKDIMKKYDDLVLFAQRKVMEANKQHESVLNASRSQTSLFGIGAMKSRILGIGQLDNVLG